MVRHLFVLAFFAIFLNLSSAQAERLPQVVATIKPVHSLLAALMQGVGEPVLLIEKGTPLDYKPSEADLEKLKQADLIVWMGPELESSLQASLASAKNVFEMLSHSDFKVLPLRGNDDIRDPFMWLDVRNAEVFVDALFDQLVAVDAKHRSTYMKNRDALKRAVAGLDREFEFGFRAIAAGQSWLYHDTQQYFEQSYAFKVRAILSPKVGELADTMQLLTTHNQLSQPEGTCVFVEKGLTTERLSLATDGTKAQVRVLDSFGLGFKAGPTLYIDIMRHNFDTIASCFRDIGAKYTGPALPPKL